MAHLLVLTLGSSYIIGTLAVIFDKICIRQNVKKQIIQYQHCDILHAPVAVKKLHVEILYEDYVEPVMKPHLLSGCKSFDFTENDILNSNDTELKNTNADVSTDLKNTNADLKTTNADIPIHTVCLIATLSE